MTSSSSGLATDDWNVYDEVKKIKTAKDSMGRTINRPANICRQLYRDYVSEKITIDELHKTLRGKLLKVVYKMKKEKYPLKPTEETPANMEGWGKACAHIEAVNAGNKHWLGILLNDIVDGKLEAKQGKREEIEELLSEWY